MKFSIHFFREIYSLSKPHPDALREIYRYVNSETGKAEVIERWVLEINSVEELILLKKIYGNFIIIPSPDIWDDLYMLIIYGKKKPSII